MHRLAVTRPYFRIIIENNSGSNQTFLRAGVLLFNVHGTLTSPSNTNQNQYADAINTRPSVYEDEVVIGRRRGVRAFSKFAYNNDVDTGTEQIWPNGAAFTPLDAASTFTIAYTQANDGSSSEGAKTLFFQYLDSNGEYAEATHTLGDDGSDVTSFSGLGINRVAVASSGSTDTNGNNITITATTGGSQQAFIPTGKGVTQQAIYHVAHNANAIVRSLLFNSRKLSGSSPQVEILGWVYNRNVQTKFEVYRIEIDTSVENNIPITNLVGFKLNSSDVLYFEATTNTDNTPVVIRFTLMEYENVAS